MIDIATRTEMNNLALERRRVSLEEARNTGAEVATRDSAQIHDIMDGAAQGAGKEKESNTHQRARTPYSSGFYFTDQSRPDLKNLQRKEPNEKVRCDELMDDISIHNSEAYERPQQLPPFSPQAFGQTRAKLLKTLKDSKGGQKLNPRSMDMALTGRDKA
jgi:hypothetical protein